MRAPRQRQLQENGSALIEVSISYATLVVVALLSFKASVNVTATQAWTVKQSMSDAFIMRETALASRIPFSDIVGTESLWARDPSVATTTVTMGKLPGGETVTGTLHRTRIPDTNNLTTAGGVGTNATNPAGTEAWKLQSLLVYNVGEKRYVKSRTVLRIR